MWKKILIGLLLAAIIVGAVGYQKYQQIFGPNVPTTLDQPYINIPTGASFEEVLSILQTQQIIQDTASFVWVAEQMSYIKPQMRSGRFRIEGGWSNRELINHLRGGKQSPVKVVLTNERLPEDIAGKVSQVIEADSISIDALLRNTTFLEERGYTSETVMSLFIPNTYELFWNTNAEAFFDRMQKENTTFWNAKNRKDKAAQQGMSPQEVYTLASIVERETNQKDEKPRIAGVYLNRLEIGMLLQADPTVVFATRDFTTRRVTYKHLEYDSPYNTYKYPGLPPGPISMAEISSIDAVLDAEEHNYVYFCAIGDGTGYHAFAKTLSGHNANAKRYYRNLRKRGKR